MSLEIHGSSLLSKEVKAVAITIDEVLSLPKTKEKVHWGKRSFRVNHKIYAVIQEDGVKRNYG